MALNALQPGSTWSHCSYNRETHCLEVGLLSTESKKLRSVVAAQLCRQQDRQCAPFYNVPEVPTLPRATVKHSMRARMRSLQVFHNVCNPSLMLLFYYRANPHCKSYGRPVFRLLYSPDIVPAWQAPVSSAVPEGSSMLVIVLITA